MIRFQKKTETTPQPASVPATPEVSSDDAAEASKARHKKSDPDGTKRRMKQTEDDNRLI